MRAVLLAVSVLVLVSAQAFAQQPPTASVEVQLCRSQLELLVSGNKLTDEEIARFKSQCDCLEKVEGAEATCTTRDL